MNGHEMICPLDGKYLSDKTLTEKLLPYLSEEGAIRYLLQVEVALVAVLARKGLCPARVAEEVSEAASKVTPDRVAQEESRTKHPVMAIANCLRHLVSREAQPYVHFMATSADIVCSADACRYKAFTELVLLPRLMDLEKTLIILARRERNTLQIGRTHGQHAEPVTFGFQVAQYVSRMGGRILKIAHASRELRGKFAGAVGAYNSMALFLDDPEEFEREVLAELGLSPSPISTQIVEAEFLVDYVHTLISAFGILANIADDMRHLQRTEIGEVEELFDEEQVGSSTMPQKRNPIVFETVKSLWKVFMPMIVTVYSDQISEHQRDLTNRESQRFVAEIAASLYMAADKVDSALKTLSVCRDRMEENLQRSIDMICAEPAHLLLSAQGFADAHEFVRRLTITARKGKKDLRELLFEEQQLSPYLKTLSDKQREVLRDPRNYSGISSSKTDRICDQWESEMDRLAGILAETQDGKRA